MMNRKNIVKNVQEGKYTNINSMEKNEIEAGFIEAGEEEVILSLNKSYEISKAKKKGILVGILNGLFTFSMTVAFKTALNVTNDMDKSGIKLEGYLSAEKIKTSLIIMVSATLLLLLATLLEKFSINKIEDYTHEAELFILEHKPEAMKDLLQKKYENTTGARIKSLFKRNKNKEEM